MASVVSSGILISFIVSSVTCNGIGSIFHNRQQLTINSRIPQKVSNLNYGDISNYIQSQKEQNSGLTEAASVQFMLHLFKDLVHGKELNEAVGHTNGQTRNFIVKSDTIRSFSPSKCCFVVCFLKVWVMWENDISLCNKNGAD